MYGNQRTLPFRNGSRSLILLCLLVPFFVACAYPADTMTSTVLIGNSRIDVTFEEGRLHAPKEDVMKWVQWSAEAVANYYGHFPVPHLALRLIPADGAGVRGGRTFGDHGSHISIHVGSDTTWADFADDWMLTHEMVHLAFPSVADEHHWIEEGIATYVEPIARIQAGQMNAPDMWSDLVRDMPKGVPKPDDKGLDHTRSWANTYWGGAVFCFLADVEIRKQTDNHKGLQDALRGILNSGCDIRQDWKLDDAFAAGDHATGTTVLMDLYGKMKDHPMPVDLMAMWKQLGIEPDGRSVRLDDNAPLAAIRIAITRRDSAASGSPSTRLVPTAVFAGRTARSPRPNRPA
jgi:hypothetical protein